MYAQWVPTLAQKKKSVALYSLKFLVEYSFNIDKKNYCILLVQLMRKIFCVPILY